MQALADQIMERASTLPEGAPIAAKSLLHLGTRAAVDQALSRLVRRGRLMRAGRGVSCARWKAGSAPAPPRSRRWCAP
jgi:hypothetical protein